MLYDVGQLTLFLGLVAATASIAIFWNIADQSLLLGWLGLIAGLTGIRFVVIKGFYNPKDANQKKWGTIYVLGSLLAGICWGMVVLLFDSQWHAAYQAMLLMLVLGIVSGSITTNAIYPYCYASVFAPVLLIVVLVMFNETDRAYWLFALLIVVYGAQLYLTSNKYTENLRNAIALQISNQTLLQDISNSNQVLQSEIDEHRRTERKLKNAIDQNQLILNSAGEGIIGVTTQGTFTFANPVATNLFGYTTEEILGKNFLEVMFPNAETIDGEQFNYQRILTAWREGKGLERESAVFYQSEGFDFDVEYISTPIVDQGEVTGAVVVFSDITKRVIAEERLKEANEKLKLLASVDGLTGIFNRRTFDKDISTEWCRHNRTGNTLALVMLDIDYFKSYNDFYGHPGGDDCLKRVAKILRQVQLRLSDRIYRYGGEEFAIILPDTSESTAIIVAERLRQAVSDSTIAHEKSEVADYVTASFGAAAIKPTTQSSPEILIERADEALLAAKRQGRNRVMSYDEINS